MMERGDIGSYAVYRVYVVWEGLIASQLPQEHSGVLRHLTPRSRRSGGNWEPNQAVLASLVDISRHNIALNVVTFLGQGVADLVPEMLRKHAPAIAYADVESYSEAAFVKMLAITMDVKYVYDADPKRCLRWGWRASCVDPSRGVTLI